MIGLQDIYDVLRGQQNQLNAMNENIRAISDVLERMLEGEDRAREQAQKKKIQPKSIMTADGAIVRYELDHNVWLINKLDKDGLISSRYLDDNGEYFTAELDGEGNVIKRERINGIPTTH